MKDLTPEKAFIFRITHIKNVPWILRNGILCKNATKQDPDFVNIGNTDLIAKRTHRTLSFAPNRTLADYVPFYFTPRSPMLYNIKTGYGGITRRENSEIVVFATSLRKLASDGTEFVFSDRHAYLTTASFYTDLDDLSCIDWNILQNSDFQRDSEDPGKVERYQAEALVHQRVGIDNLLGVVTHNEAIQGEVTRMVEAAGQNLKVAVRPSWYFR